MIARSSLLFVLLAACSTSPSSPPPASPSPSPSPSRAASAVAVVPAASPDAGAAATSDAAQPATPTPIATEKALADGWRVVDADGAGPCRGTFEVPPGATFGVESASASDPPPSSGDDVMGAGAPADTYDGFCKVRVVLDSGDLKLALYNDPFFGKDAIGLAQSIRDKRGGDKQWSVIEQVDHKKQGWSYAMKFSRNLMWVEALVPWASCEGELHTEAAMKAALRVCRSLTLK